MTYSALSKSQTITQDILYGLLAVVLLLVSSVCAADKINLDIISVSPEPRESKKKNFSYDRLTDQSVNVLRMWTRAGAMSWTQPIPVVVSASVSKKFIGQKGTVKIHMAMRQKSGVKLPARIDVYAEEADNQVHHIGEWRKEDSEIKQGRLSDSVWIEVPIANIFKNIKFVIHSDGRFLSFDELELYVRNNDDHADNRVSSAYKPVVQDSLQRFSKNINHQLNFDMALDLNDQPDMELQLIHSWADFPDAEQGEVLESLLFSSTERVKLLRLINRSEQERCVEPISTLPLSMSWVEPVLAVNGLKKYDPLVPVKGCKLLPTLGHAYLWLAVDSQSQPQEGNLFIKTDDETIREIMLKSERIVKKDTSCLKVDVWAYQNEKPIWNNKQQAQALLKSAGVNVFFIPPSEIPTIDAKKKQIKRWQALNQYVDFYAEESGELLLFLGLSKKSRQWDAKYLKSWLKKLTNLMASHGYSNESWALYPFDEINRKTYKPFIDFAKRVKRYDPKIMIYSNPVYSASSKTALSKSDVEEIISLSDIVQPDMKMADQYSSDMFTKDGAEFWIYENPSYPAKSESLSFYKELPERVVKKGASGVGFWAFSDTSKSSAWSDVDGRRPDWSAVYEYQESVIGSRRWSAFKEGVRLACE
ncbi:hypothetical protein N9W57_05470 [Pseudomonadales bacterium]|nr:hypothetical protein [Pseudomonadales bacterium]